MTQHNIKIEVPIPNHVHQNERTLSGFIDLVRKYKEHIACLYFPLGHVDTDIDVWGIRAPNYIYGGGVRDLEAVLKWENALQMIMTYCDVPVKILLNNIYSADFHNPESWKKIVKKLHYYRERYQVVSVTVADVSIVPKLRAETFQISLSTNSHNSLQELDMYLMMYGMEGLESVVLQRDLNRNPKKLHHFAAKNGLSDKLILMVNEGCVNACVYKNSGDVEISISDLKAGHNNIHVIGCTALMKNARWMFLTSQFLTKPILEQHYKFINRIKIAGRNLNTSQIKYMMQHYVDGADRKLSEICNVSAQDDLRPSHLSGQYWQDVLSCNKECAVCRKCEAHYSDALSKQSQE